MSSSASPKASKRVSADGDKKGKNSIEKGKKEETSKSASNAAVIKIPGAKVTESNAAPSTRARPQPTQQGKEVKSILKKDSKSGRRAINNSNVKKEEKKKAPKRKKTLYEKVAAYFGIYVGPVIITDPNALEAIQALDLQPKHLRKLRAKFELIDLDGSGAIDYDEFFEAVGETRSPFTDKLFALIDLDGSGTIEFDEYVRVMATYCMFTKDEIMRFCFECFDVDRSGTIDEKEFVELCKSINNANPSFPSNFKRALEEFDVNEDGLIDYGEFLEIERRYPLIMFPAFRLQDTMQRNSLGERGWLKVIENYERTKRIEEYKSKNGGKAPPDSLGVSIGKVLLPCFFRERVHINVGASMEARHRGEDN